MQNIEESIKQLKSISPSKDYQSKSLGLILTYPQNAQKPISISIIFEMFKFSAALGLAGIIIMISITGIFPSLNARLLSPVLLSGLNEQKIQNEANQVDIKITVAEANYYNDSLTKVATALDETAKSGPGHLNSAILEKEMNDLNIDQHSSENINALLNKLTL